MKSIHKIVIAVSKGLELLHWGAAALMALLFIGCFAAKDWFVSTLSSGIPAFGSTLTTYGYEMLVTAADNQVNPTAIALFAIGACLIFVLMAMVFRNIYLIMKTTAGKTSFSEGTTPFQKSNVRMVKEIGIFYIAVPVVGLIMSIISRMIIGVETAEIYMNMDGIITGIIILCLAQIFAYGTELQNDVDGLV